jgi:hypothetical protein
MNGIFLCCYLLLATTVAAAARHGTSTPIVDDDIVICQIRVLDVQFENQPSRREYRCVSDGSSDMAYEIDLDEASVGGFEDDLAAGTLYASIPHGTLPRKQKGDKVIAPEGVKVELSRGKPEKKESVRRRRHSSNATPRRRLMATSGTIPVLVIRVSGNDVAPTLSAAELSNRIFGIGNDEVNLKSVYDSCSAGKLDFVPATGTGIVNGVTEIKLDRDIFNTTSTSVDNDVLKMAKVQFGDLSTSTQFDHVMLCLPPGTVGGSWIAYAYLNWYVQRKEHNLKHLKYFSN